MHQALWDLPFLPWSPASSGPLKCIKFFLWSVFCGPECCARHLLPLFAQAVLSYECFPQSVLTWLIFIIFATLSWHVDSYSKSFLVPSTDDSPLCSMFSAAVTPSQPHHCVIMVYSLLPWAEEPFIHLCISRTLYSFWHRDQMNKLQPNEYCWMRDVKGSASPPSSYMAIMMTRSFKNAMPGLQPQKF